MAEASFAWLSVAVKRGTTTMVPRKIVKIEWDNVFGELLTAVYPDLHSEIIRGVSISKNIDPVHKVDVSAPLTDWLEIFLPLPTCSYPRRKKSVKQ
jgi:hypothetical protein